MSSHPQSLPSDHTPSQPAPSETPAGGLKALSKGLMYRLLRPAFKDTAAALERIERKLEEGGEQSVVTWRGGMDGSAVNANGTVHVGVTRKYREELSFWNGLVKGGSVATFGGEFAAIYGGWQRGRAEEMRDFLGLTPEAFAAWCGERTAVEVGPGPFPAVAVAPWRLPVAVDPLADGYLAEGLVPDECRHVLFVAATGEHIPLPSANADVVVMENCLDHCASPGAVLREARRLLKPGGLLWLLVDLMTYSDEMHPHPFSEESLRGLLRREGFTVIRDRVSDHKSHPHAYGEYRGLLFAPQVGHAPGGNPAPSAVVTTGADRPAPALV